MSDVTSRREAMIWGAFVADAATMGLHWIYDQQRIRDVAPDAPEFHAPDAADYADVPAYFAHPTRQAGDLSQYGEQALVMLRAVAHADYDRATYQSAFRSHFGYGGNYVGYIDRPTRDTLDQISVLERSAVTRARTIDPSVDDQTHGMMVTKVTAVITKSSDDLMRAQIESAVREIHDSDALVAYAQKLADVLTDAQGFAGSDDMQLPAVSKLPALVTRHGADASIVADAVRVTNNNDTAVAFAQTTAQLLQQALTTSALPDLDGIAAAADPDVRDAVTPALARLGDTTEGVTADIGLSCYLKFGIPSVMHNLATTDNFTTAIRTNIYAGGDNCGRAVILGATLGAMHGIGGAKGIPQAWIDRLTRKSEIAKLIAALPA